MNNWQRLIERRNRSAWVVLLVCILLTMAAWYGLRKQALKNAEQQFNLHVNDVIFSIEERLRQHEQILLGGAGLYDASKSVERDEWHAYVERLNLSQHYPGIQGVGYSQVILPKDLRAHIAAVHAEGFPAYTVRPSGKRPLYTSIIYLEPFSGRNLAVFGYDMMSEPVRAKAMRMAVDNGMTTISGKVQLVQETQGRKQAGFLMYLPVYRKHLPLVTSQQRWDALQGFVYSPYRVDDLMEDILGSRLHNKLHFAIFDGLEETDNTRIYSRDLQPAKGAALPMMTAVRTIRAYGNTWTVRLNSSAAFEEDFHSPLNAVITALGGGISVLLFAMVSFLVFRRERTEELAQQMTEEIRLNVEKLRQTKYLLDSVIENIPTMVFLKRVGDLRFELLNRAGEKLLGYARSELIGKNDHDFFPQDQADSFTAADRNVLASDNVLEIPEEQIKTAKGEMRYLHTWKIALRNESGDPTHLLGISIDITERKRAEDELRKLSSAIEQSPVSVVITNADGNIEYVNNKFSEVTGYAAHDVIGQNPRIVQSGLTPLEVYESMWQTILDGRQWRGKLQNRKKNGELFWEEVYISALRDSEGQTTNFVAVKEDITERMRIERMKSEFVSTVSHELRTPLTSIRGSLGLLAGGVGGMLPAHAKALVDIAHKNSDRLILLVNDILDMEKIESGKMEFKFTPTELMPLLKHSLESNHAYAEQFNVTYELEGKLCDVMVNVDVNRLMQVLANLLSNAAKFSPPGDKVIISTAINGNNVRIAVSDHGSGVSEQFRSRIFQKFVQADSSDTRKKGGTGLGLSITKAIVEQMGGSIGFDSQPHVLTTFFVEFPIWKETPPVTVDAVKADQYKRVLICEDDHAIAALLRMMLEQAGLEADIAYDASQAKHMLMQRAYAAMTLDLGLPGQDGMELIHELRSSADTVALPIVVVSANALEGRKDGEAFNVIDWIGKPIDKWKLVEAMQHALNHVSGAHPSGVRPKVLHVEDDPDVLQVVNAIVGEFAEMDKAISIADAQRMLAKNRYDLVILDISLPDGSGLKLLPLLKEAKPPIPVLVFSAYDMAQEDMGEIKSVLVKSRTDNKELLAVIKKLIGVE